MMTTELDSFMLRDLHTKIKIGTASDRYVGLIGQILKRRSRSLAEKLILIYKHL